MNRPDKSEYDPKYQKYIDLVESGSFNDILTANTQKTVAFFKAVPLQKHLYRYAENKWTVKEVFMHMIDTERGFSYRAVVCARRDGKTPLYGMDEDHYAANVTVTDRSMEDMIEEFLAVRGAFGFVFKNTTPGHLEFKGNGRGHPISARAIGFIAIGHVKHHIHVIRRRYL